MVDNFKFWCQKILPLVYDNSLSYYETLCKVSEKLNELIEYVNGLEADFLDEANAYTDSVTANILKQSINYTDSKTATLETDINDLYSLNNQINLQITELYQAVKDNSEYYNVKIDGMLKYLSDYIDKLLVDKTTVYVVSPVSNKFVNIQTCVNELYNYFQQFNSITCEEYDILYLTATEYDSMNITADNFDKNSRWVFFKKLYLRMISPFNGLYETYENIINSLANLHKNALTADEYDNKKLTATVYDGYKITAYNYDWNAVAIL